MYLRKLKRDDAEGMLAWMHDITVVEKLQANFMDKTIEDCYAFIEHSQSEEGIHLAIANEEDQYIGTVSLKHISGGSAEFAIVICKDAMGKGYSAQAMKEMIYRGFHNYGLATIYWCVAPDNLRAIKFYDKNHFLRVSHEKIRCETLFYAPDQIESFVWYQILREDQGLLGCEREGDYIG